MNLNIRISDEQHALIKERAEANGFESVSAFIKYVALNCKVTATDKK